MVGCSSDTADQSTAPLTRADAAAIGGFVFPPSTADYRTTRDGNDGVYITFAMKAQDLEGFAAGSNLDLEPGRRVIMHASPIWDQNPTGAFSGTESDIDGVRRQVEVVQTPGTDDVTVRIGLDMVAGSS